MAEIPAKKVKLYYRMAYHNSPKKHTIMRSIRAAFSGKTVKHSIFWLVLIYFTLLLCDHLVSVSGLLDPQRRITINHVPDQPYQKQSL